MEGVMSVETGRIWGSAGVAQSLLRREAFGFRLFGSKHCRAGRCVAPEPAGSTSWPPLELLRGEVWRTARGSTAFNGLGEEVHLELDDVMGVIVGASISIHRRLGPGLFESVYETVLASMLERRG